MRFLRQVLMVASLTLLLILAVALAGVAAGVNTYFGSDGAVTAQGPRIELDELASCTNIVVDLDRIEMALPQQLAILPGPEQKLRISTEPQVTISAVLLPREEVDAVLLGFNTCLMNLDSQNWSITRSAVGQPWLQVDQVAGRTDITAHGFRVGTIAVMLMTVMCIVAMVVTIVRHNEPHKLAQVFYCNVL